MTPKKIISLSLLGVLLLGGVVAISHIHSARQARQQHLANQVLTAVSQETENCLKKMAGQRDKIAPATGKISAQISSCYLQHIGINVPTVSKDACIGLTQAKKKLKYATILSVQADGKELTSELCQDNIPIHFELETTPNGVTFYENLREPIDKKETNIKQTTTAQLASTNASPSEIIANLKRPKQNSNVSDKPEQKNVLVGTIVSLRQTSEKKLFEWTISTETGTIYTIIQDNSLGLKPNDSVILIPEEGRLKIRNKLGAY